MSSYRWELYGIDRAVSVGQLQLDEFEEQLNKDDVIELSELESLDKTGAFVRSDEDIIRYNCIKLDSRSWQVVIVNCENEEKNAIMALCFEDDELKDIFLELFKDMIGCVCWPIYFCWENKLNILDNVVNGTHWYDTIMNFSGKDQNFEENRLNRWNITINKYDCEIMGKSSIPNSYSKSIIPYIESISGIRFNQTINRSIILRTLLTIRNKDIITIRRSIPISLIISQFKK